MKILRYVAIGLWLINAFYGYSHAYEKSEKPAIMVIINEQIWVDDKIVYDYYGNLSPILNIWTSISQANTTFMDVFLKKGFRVLGGSIPETTKGNVSREDILKVIEGDDFTSTYLGNYLKADIIIAGKAIARGTAMLKSSNQKSARANMNVRAIKVESGEIIAVESANATAVAIDEISAGVDAVKKAAEQVAQNLIEEISKKY